MFVQEIAEEWYLQLYPLLIAAGKARPEWPDRNGEPFILNSTQVHPGPTFALHHSRSPRFEKRIQTALQDFWIRSTPK